MLREEIINKLTKKFLLLIKLSEKNLNLLVFSFFSPKSEKNDALI